MSGSSEGGGGGCQTGNVGDDANLDYRPYVVRIDKEATIAKLLKMMDGIILMNRESSHSWIF